MAPTKKITPKKRKTKELTISKDVLSVYDFTGKQSGTVELEKKILQKKVNSLLVAQAIRVYQTNRRQGTKFTKSRSDVIASGRKIYRQKGTGRARHGDIKAPIFVGGGIAFGPKQKDYELKLPKKMKVQAFGYVFIQKIKEKNVFVIDGFSKTSGKTKEIVNLLKLLEIGNKTKLFVLDKNMKSAYKAIRNIPRTRSLPASAVSMLDLLEHEYILLAKETFDLFKDKLEAKN